MALRGQTWRPGATLSGNQFSCQAGFGWAQADCPRCLLPSSRDSLLPPGLQSKGKSLSLNSVLPTSGGWGDRRSLPQRQMHKEPQKLLEAQVCG